ncbi:NAD(P)-dependent oxidoreductase [Spirilliplanes yamanashiensis]|uniref:2-hydroxy-3-oxopropionate reductase n=1 Tax=Spirilliplanes yamanashiensis TaxID=42233 RepID=A0A8J3YB78_9ACTN|nr:NAD(P)-binding domain-containing protein [Spirilliplanes yamanashiensis]MDP9819051.1 2-hydroxy-3-oxopropionate reductase [Spirilliplanes yamanashiensis]GIJ05506.1 2-hydroxy-3-oxopropionate reductase [Spirilliplanes yamanashiensis]
MDGPQRIAFIGLGIMGAPMAANLLKAGYQVAVYNRSPGAAERLAALGARPATGVADAVRGADVVITVLPDTPDVEAVFEEILAAGAPGLLHADMSTIDPGASRAMAARAAEDGLRALDAPVSGGEQGAIEGALSIMVGGEAADVAYARPVLEAMGSTVVHVGPSGSGQTVKAANQLLVAGIIELVAEAIVLVEASGVDPEPAVRVLAGGLAGNRILDRKAAGMLARDFTPGFRVDLHHKDLGIVLAAARAAGVTIPLGALAAQLMGALRAQGHGGSDHTALLGQVDRLSGRGRGTS